MENSNTQPTPTATPPTSTGPTAEELMAKVSELEKQSEGRLRDLQDERRKRQDLEARFNSSAPAPSANAAPDVAQDELGKVLSPYIAPLLKRVQVAEAVAAQTVEDKAMAHLVEKTGRSRQALLDDRGFQDKLTAVVRKYGFAGNIYDITTKAYEVLELENLKSKEAERARAATASGSSSLPSGTPPPVVFGAKEFSEKEWSNMPLHEYEKLSEAGTFNQNDDGKIVFTPTSK